MPDKHVHPMPQQDYFLQHIHDCFVYSGFNVSNYGDSTISFESLLWSLMLLIPWKLSLIRVSAAVPISITQLYPLYSAFLPASTSLVLLPFKSSWVAVWAISCCCFTNGVSISVISSYNSVLQGSWLFWLLFFFECLLLLTFFLLHWPNPHSSPLSDRREADLFIHRHTPLAFAKVCRRHTHHFRCFKLAVSLYKSFSLSLNIFIALSLSWSWDILIYCKGFLV